MYSLILNFSTNYDKLLIFQIVKNSFHIDGPLFLSVAYARIEDGK